TPTTPTEPTTPTNPDDPGSSSGSGWKLVWEDEFDGADIDTTVWSRIPEGTPDWAKCQSLDDRCYEKRPSSLVLRGIVNNDTQSDKRQYLCGGIWTRGKKAFSPGKIEVRARMTQAQGAWPAIWMMPYTSVKGWPYDGEIDIMEHLNFDRIVYQTLHSGYIDVEGHRYNPNYSNQSYVDNVTEYHVYGAEIYPDKVILTIDGYEKLYYPKMDVAGQFPYYTEWDLRIDMQLGGSWVGNIIASQLPVELEVDWVRYYER
ncbi:MAG: glycoside hydrolase family 16 protein, partial [Paramuribaculum sp.]|nr:glycoside hydrolase family 16 protein [Paramuribaculum sp.]